jgi:hypothetical protein
VGEAGCAEAATVKWICRVRFIGRSMPGTEGGPTFIPFDDFCMNTEFLQWSQELVDVQWRWVKQWERL